MPEKQTVKVNAKLNATESDAATNSAGLPKYEYERDRDTNIHISPDVINNCTPHFHNQLEIIAVQTSSQLVQINEKQSILKAGELAIADCFDVHSYTYCDAISTVLILPDRFLTEYKLYKQDRGLATNFIHDRRVYDETFPLLARIPLEKNPLAQKGLINVLLGRILEYTGLSAQKVNSKQDISLIHNILDYIEQHYAEDLSLKSISAHFSYSPSHFSRLFNSFFHYTLADYVNAVRLRKFFELKEKNPDRPLINLILESGFSSVPTFYRLFTKKLGVSPFKYYKTTE